MNLDEFADTNAPETGGETFQLENSKLLDVHVDGSVMAKAGSMVAYTGEISFERTSAGGVTGFLKRQATGEGSVMMEASGTGNLYLADRGKRVQVLELGDGEEISVNGNDVLAFESGVDWDIRTMDSIAGVTAGGLFNVYLTGPGYVAITTHGEPLVVPTPVRTDPQATVAWSSDVSPGVETDRTIKGFLGRSSGETYQLAFDREGGFVVVQPFEEVGPGQ